MRNPLQIIPHITSSTSRVSRNRSACLLLVVTLAVTVTLTSSNPSIPHVDHIQFNGRPIPSTLPIRSILAPASYATQYDKQIGFTFTQDFKSLAFNVTAVAQHGPDGTGPAYLLNGLTDMGYWYQVGISYNWGYTTNTGTGYTPGFQAIYEVFNPNGRSVYPTTGGGGVMPLAANPNDIVQLSLSFSNAYVVMTAYDWNTGETASQTTAASEQRSSMDKSTGSATADSLPD